MTDFKKSQPNEDTLKKMGRPTILFCPHCGVSLQITEKGKMPNFCGSCGRSLKWAMDRGLRTQHEMWADALREIDKIGGEKARAEADNVRLRGELTACEEHVVRLEEKLERLLHDKLTGLPNRENYEDKISYQLQLLKRRIISVKKENPEVSDLELDPEFALVIGDIDMFKKVNDTFGHIRGDQVLRTTAKVIRRMLRDVDIVGRYGGEEFLFFFPYCGGQVGLFTLLQKLANQCYRVAYPGKDEGEYFQITMTFGGILITNPFDDLESLITKADKALYHGKQNGRDRLVLWQSDNEFVVQERQENLADTQI